MLHNTVLINPSYSTSWNTAPCTHPAEFRGTEQSWKILWKGS